jgi:hypothetical protein
VCPSPPPTSCQNVDDGCPCVSSGGISGICSQGACEWPCPAGSGQCATNLIDPNALCCREVGGVLTCKPGSGQCLCDNDADCPSTPGNNDYCCADSASVLGGYCSGPNPCVDPVGSLRVQTTEASAAEEDSCTPATCAELGVSCGPANDGCGGTIDCGACCTPRDVCNDGECGTLDDGCGGPLECGPCPEEVVTTPAPEVTCASLGDNCNGDGECCEGLCRDRDCGTDRRTRCRNDCPA